MGRCWPGAKLLENGRMRDALLNETSFSRPYTTARSHSSFWTTRRRHSPPNISPQLATTPRHPSSACWPVAHIAPESVPTPWSPPPLDGGSVAGNTCPTASAKSSCDDCSTCDQGIHAPPPSRLQRYFHAETVLRSRRHNPGTPAPPG